MATKTTLVSIVHDEGYGDDLLTHINLAFRGKDMRAENVVRPKRLVWRTVGDNWYEAASRLGKYEADNIIDSEKWEVTIDEVYIGDFTTLAAAQYACQSHYDETMWAGMELQQQPEGKGEG